MTSSAPSGNHATLPDADGWLPINIESIADLMTWADRVDGLQRPATKAVFRGQADRLWGLVPSLARSLPPGIAVADVVRYELKLLDEFVWLRGVRGMTADLFSAHVNPSNEWQAMQHHGAPTRLLDWTRSFFVAAYFAVRERHEVDGAIWAMLPTALPCFHGTAHREALFAKFVDSNEEELVSAAAHSEVWAYYPTRPTDRIISQQGQFTLCSNPVLDHARVLSRNATVQRLDGFTLGKFIIPASLKPVLLHRLRSMNIDARTLFPGDDGIGRAIHELATIHRHRLLAPEGAAVEATGAPVDVDGK